MPKAGSVREFAFFFNIEGVDNDTGVMFRTPRSADIIQNLNLDTLGQWTAHNQGFENLSAQLESGATIDGMDLYTEDDGTDHLITIVNGKVKDMDPNDGSVTAEISTGFTAGNIPDFQSFKGDLYITEKSLEPQKWTGSGSITASSPWPITLGSDTYSKPKYIESHNNRMAFFNFQGTTKYPAHVVLSDELAPETFTSGVGDTDAIIAEINPGDGQEILGAKSLYLPAIQESVMIVFKHGENGRSIWQITGRTPSTVQIDLINSSITAINNRSIVTLGSDLIFLDENNIYSLSTATQSGNIEPKFLGSEKIKDTLSTINLTQKDKIWSTHMPWRQEIWWGIPTGASTYTDCIIQYSYKTSEKGKANAFSVRKLADQTAATKFNRTLLTGGNDGFVNNWHDDSDYAGTGVNWKYDYPFYNFKSQAQYKRVVEAYAWFMVSQDETITIETEWRGGGSNDKTSLTKSIDLTANVGAVYGATAPPAGVYGTDIYGESQRLKKVPFHVFGDGEQLRFKFSGTTSGGLGPTFLGVSGLVEFGDHVRNYL